MTAPASAPWAAEFTADWSGFGGTHGGLVLAALVRAARNQIGGGVPLSVSAHIFAPIPPGRTPVQAKILRGGRTPSVQTSIAGAASALVVMYDGELSTRDLTWPPPETPDTAPPTVRPDQIEELRLPVELVSFAQHLDIRPTTAARPLSGGDDPAFEVWIRLRRSDALDGGLSDHELAAVLLDALPPALYAIGTATVPIPTIEFTAHFAPSARRRPDWYLMRHRAVWATEHACLDQSELFTDEGYLVAQARQVRRIVRR